METPKDGRAKIHEAKFVATIIWLKTTVPTFLLLSHQGLEHRPCPIMTRSAGIPIRRGLPPLVTAQTSSVNKHKPWWPPYVKLGPRPIKPNHRLERANAGSNSARVPASSGILVALTNLSGGAEGWSSPGSRRTQGPGPIMGLPDQRTTCIRPDNIHF